MEGVMPASSPSEIVFRGDVVQSGKVSVLKLRLIRHLLVTVFYSAQVVAKRTHNSREYRDAGIVIEQRICCT
jgi:hypothetical protein